MDITRSILNSLTNNEVYNYLLNEISILYDKYHYLSISNEVMNKIIDDEIDLSRNNYNDNGDYRDYFKNRVEARIVALGTKLFNDSEINYYLIDKYIKEYLEVPEDYLEAKKSLRQICSLFSKYCYIPEPTIIINLINTNEIFSKILEIITCHHKEYFKNYGVSQLFSDSNMASLIGIYCMVKGIETNEDISFEDEHTTIDSLGEYFNEINRVPPITISEMQELGKRIKLGDEAARNRLTEGNLKLVVSVAKAFYRANNTVSFQDLINAGNIGLMRAASKFDIDLGFRFSTYATQWIRLEVVREIQNNAKTIRIPISAHEKINSYNRLKEQLIQQMGTDISYQEMAKAMNISIQKAYEYERIQDTIVSLNAGEAGKDEMLDMVCIDNYASDIELKNLSIDMQRIFKNSGLTDKQIEILSLRYGIIDKVSRTLEEVGRILGVKRQTIAYIEARALYKLRTYEGTREIAQYMDNPSQALEMLDRFNEAYSQSKLNQNKFNPLTEQLGYNTIKRRVK